MLIAPLTALFLAASPQLAADAPGKWRPVDRDTSLPNRLPKPLRIQMHTKLPALLAPMAAAIGEAPPGCEVAPHLNVRDAVPVEGGPAAGELYLQIFDLYRRADGTVTPTGESSTTFFVAINSFTPFFTKIAAEDERGNMYREPEKNGTVHGYPRFNGAVLIARDKRLPWRPVSRERYTTAFLGRLKKQHDRFLRNRSPNAIDYDGKTIATVEAELAALSAEERALPMQLPPGGSWERWEGFAPKNGLPVVEADPTYFEGATPTSFRFISVLGFVGSTLRQTKPITDRFKSIWKALDLDAYAKLLEP